MLLPINNHLRAGSTFLILIFVCCLSSVKAEFRTWKDKNGNSINAELINTFGGKIVLQDKKGKIFKLDPTKLSGADQLYLNPPPPRYEIDLMKRSKQMSPQNMNSDAKERITVFEYDFILKVHFLTDDPRPTGLAGVLFIIGEDAQGNMVVIDKADGPIKKIDAQHSQLEGQGCELRTTRDEDGKLIKGMKYKGYLIMLLADDGTTLKQQASHDFLTDNSEKALTLFVGDTFNVKLDTL